jgi:hypothetical protein
MKFFTASGRAAPSEVAGLVRGFLAFALLFLAGLFAWRAASCGLTAGALSEYFLGPPGFPEGAAPAAAVWEDVHLTAFFHGFLVLTSGAALIRWNGVPKKSWLIAAAAAAGIVDALAPAAVHYLHPAFVWLRVIGFPALAAAVFVCCGSALVALHRSGARAANGATANGREAA